MGTHSPDSVRTAADCLNYETRALREPLHRSNERVKSARGKAFSDLTPRQQDMANWDPPQQAGGVPDVANLNSDIPEVHEMQQALLNFESELCYSEAPSRDRAFFSALRCLLSEISTERNPQEQDTKLRAVCKWFLKYKPRGSHIDASTSAVLATSLSIPAKPIPGAAPPAATQQHRSNGVHTPIIRGQGNKHEFNALFSRGPKGKGVQPKGTLALLREAMGGKNTQEQKGTEQKQRVDMPLAWQPASAVSGSQNLQHHATAPGATRPNASAGPDYDPSSEDSKGTGVAHLVPRDRVRSVETLKPADTGRPKGNVTSTASSWFRGPYKPEPAAAGAAFATGRSSHPRSTAKATSDMDDLSSKWSNIARVSSKSEEFVEGQLQGWSEQRARLESEMLRRQEAVRHSSPLRDQGDGCSGPTASQGSQDYLSAYQGVTVEAVSAVTMGLDKLSPEHPAALHHLAVPHSIVATARDVRNAAQTEYARDMQRLKELGLRDSHDEVMHKALAPVADKPYLDLLAALPKPGQHLPSRPASVPSRSKKIRPESGKKAKKM
ncbi:hypothetical protein DUNSADRAFT_13375 [Dunaliella salina]|uniref:Uncharacterized protein n=1 Tax=Dunaliella salina TaxID=3046 RepID=A0ABQ7G9G2_DUNSA|nr:hypothetical protein DUNSADRAFT_13375 [Dunaliella salina]|eukprot:KAF5831245.1 hypothetical protein DUNSADRAFT_13375 [Dunaliella salina]